MPRNVPSRFVGSGDMVNGPLIVPTPTPAAWAINGAQARRKPDRVFRVTDTACTMMRGISPNQTIVLVSNSIELA